MTTTTPPDAETDRAYWRAYIAKMDAEQAKAAKEAKWYPFIPLMTSAAFATIAVAFGTWLGTHFFTR